MDCPREKGKYSPIYQRISVRSADIGSVQICTEASMQAWFYCSFTVMLETGDFYAANGRCADGD